MQDDGKIFTDKQFWSIGAILLVLVIAAIVLGLS
jgi:hypothetical protein